MDDKTLKKYFDMLTAAWKLLRNFKDMKTQEDIERLHYAAKKIHRKYHCRFMLDLIAAVCNELSRRAGIDEKWNM